MKNKDTMKELNSENLETITLQIYKKGLIEQIELLVYEINEEIILKVKIDETAYSVTGECIFETLQKLREELEKSNIMILCNGSAINVYPSLMQKEFGGTKAYKLTLGKQAKLEDVVDIFDYDKSLKIVNVYEQKKFYEEWLESLI